jgi:hypothetical protein
MDDLASKLGELLNSPGAVDKMKSLAGLLGGAAEPAQSSAPQPEQNSPLAGLGNLGNLGNLGGLGGLDGDMLQTIMKVAPMLSSFKQEDDNTRLLHALRPMLCEERQKKLDEATKLLQLMRMLPLLKDSGIL